jgi:DNA-binding Lrp family transcriptional regulator
LTKSVTNTRSQILRLLAVNKKMAQYNIPEKIGKDYSTVFRQLKKLKNKNLVKVVATITSKKRGKDKDIFGLTLFGLLVGFREDVLTTKHLPQIIEVFKEDIPLVFGEWSYFKKEGVLEIAEKHLVDVLKYCGREYKRFLENLKEISKQERFYERKKEIQEKWRQENAWAQLITQTFLYDSFQHPERDVQPRLIDISRLFASSLKEDDEKKLQQIIWKNEQLRLYCLMCAREETYSNSLRSRSFRMHDGNQNLLWDTFTVEKKIENIMLGIPYAVFKVANLALIDDWFSVAFELCKLYENYTFNSEKEAQQKIQRFTQHLAELRYGCVLNPLYPQESYNDLTKEQKDLLREQEIGTTVALSFFIFKPVQVWDKTYYQLKPNKKRIERLEKNREQTISTLKRHARHVYKELESRKES